MVIKKVLLQEVGKMASLLEALGFRWMKFYLTQEKVLGIIKM